MSAHGEADQNSSIEPGRVANDGRNTRDETVKQVCGLVSAHKNADEILDNLAPYGALICDSGHQSSLRIDE
jgi:hypothetical protein